MTSQILTVTIPTSQISFVNMNGPIVTIQWGDGSPTVNTSITSVGDSIWEVAEISYAYQFAGVYNITITLSDRCGVSNSTVLSVTLTSLTTQSVTSGHAVVLTTSLVESETESKNDKSTITGIAVGIVAVFVVAVFILLLLILLRRKYKTQESDSGRKILQSCNLTVDEFNMKSLQGVVTDFDGIEFGEIIGKGAFGVVYKLVACKFHLNL